MSNTPVADLRPIKDLASLVEGARKNPARGLRFLGCTACALDPEGLGKLAQIEDSEDRTRRTLDYLHSLTEWPPGRSDPIDAAMQGPILEASLADVALIESHFEAVSLDPPLPQATRSGLRRPCRRSRSPHGRSCTQGPRRPARAAICSGTSRNTGEEVQLDQPQRPDAGSIGQPGSRHAGRGRSSPAVSTDSTAARSPTFLQYHDDFVRGVRSGPHASPSVPAPDIDTPRHSSRDLPADGPRTPKRQWSRPGSTPAPSVPTASARRSAICSDRMDAALKTLAAISDSAERLRPPATDLALHSDRRSHRMARKDQRPAAAICRALTRNGRAENPVSAARNTLFVATRNTATLDLARTDVSRSSGP